MIINHPTPLKIVKEKNKVYIRPDDEDNDSGAELSNIPAKVLKTLLEKPDQLVTFPDIIIAVWGDDTKCVKKAIRTIDVHLIQIREFLDDCETDYEILRVRSSGIILKTQ